MKFRIYFIQLSCIATLTLVVNVGQSYTLCKDNIVQLPYIGESGEIVMNGISLADNSDNSCVLKIESCSTCQVEIECVFKEDTFNCMPDRSKTAVCQSDCDGLYMFDMYYKTETLHTYKSFKSESSNMFVAFCYGLSNDYTFSMTYNVTKKFQLLTGSSSRINMGFIHSPNFPYGYASNAETYEYKFVSSLPSDYIVIIFDDWLLSSSAKLYFNNSNISQINGNQQRPVVISKTNTLTLYFNTGTALAADDSTRYIGFRATYQFINVSDSGSTTVPVTDCIATDHVLDNVGGIIDFTPLSDRELFDCVWVLKKHPGYDKIYLKIISIKFTVPGTRQIRILGGLTSMDTQIFITDSTNSVTDGVSLYNNVGFYVRLNGLMTSVDKITIAYASVKTRPNCLGMFMCDSTNCIDPILKCDGYDHCGNKTDETIGCSDEPNAIWDKSYQYTITVGVIVPMVISVFLIMVICLLFVLVRRCRKAQLQAQSLNSASSERLGTVSEEVTNRRGRRRRRHRRGLFGNAARDMPPTYDEAIQNPPGWYLNVAFGNPVDPSLPQPPPYSEIMGVERMPQVESQLSLSSSESSRSEVTVYHLSDSSTSSEEDSPWVNYGNSDGRRSRRGRHVSSSDLDEERSSLGQISVRNNNYEGSTSNSLSMVTGDSCYRKQLQGTIDLETILNSDADEDKEPATQKVVEKMLTADTDFVIPDGAKVGEIDTVDAMFPAGNQKENKMNFKENICVQNLHPSVNQTVLPEQSMSSQMLSNPKEKPKTKPRKTIENKSVLMGNIQTESQTSSADQKSIVSDSSDMHKLSNKYSDSVKSKVSAIQAVLETNNSENPIAKPRAHQTLHCTPGKTLTSERIKLDEDTVHLGANSISGDGFVAHSAIENLAGISNSDYAVIVNVDNDGILVVNVNNDEIVYSKSPGPVGEHSSTAHCLVPDKDDNKTAIQSRKRHLHRGLDVENVNETHKYLPEQRFSDDDGIDHQNGEYSLTMSDIQPHDSHNFCNRYQKSGGTFNNPSNESIRSVNINDVHGHIIHESVTDVRSDNLPFPYILLATDDKITGIYV